MNGSTDRRIDGGFVFCWNKNKSLVVQKNALSLANMFCKYANMPICKCVQTCSVNIPICLSICSVRLVPDFSRVSIFLQKKTAALTQCPARRPLSEYVRSSKESGCKCHVYMSICNHFPSAKHEESAMQRSKATATGQYSECLEHCESANGAKQCAASFCMVLRFLSKSQIDKKGG